MPVSYIKKISKSIYSADTRTMNTRRFFSALLNEYPISVRRRNKGTDIF